MTDRDEVSRILGDLPEMRTRDHRLDVDIAEEAIMAGWVDAWYYLEDEVYTGRGLEYTVSPEEALVRGAINTDGPWWVPDTGEDHDD